MTDDRLIALLGSGDDRLADPAPAFRVALYEQLARQAGLRGRTRFDDVLRLKWLVVALLVAAAVIGAALVGGRLFTEPPEDFIRRALTAYAETAALRLDVEVSGDGNLVVMSNGAGTWRVTYGAGPWRREAGGAGGEMVAVWEPGVGGWRMGPGDRPAEPIGPNEPPYPLGTELVLADPAVGDRFPGSLVCNTWLDLGTDMIAGRPTRGVECAERDQEFWIDTERLVVLRVVAGVATPGSTPGAGYDVVAVDLAPSVDAAAFAAEPPFGWAVGLLRPGSPLPEWSGTTLDGQEVDSSALASTEFVVYLWGSWCPPCRDEMLRTIAAVDSRDDVELLTIALGDEPQAVEDALADAGVQLPVVLIVDGATIDSFGNDGVPLTILVRADGTIQQILRGTVDRSTLATAIDALLAAS